MVLCKFFQKGNCWYGHGCRFDHIYDSKYSYRAPESTRSSHDVFSTNTSRQPSSASSLFRNAVQDTSNTYLNNSSSHTFSQSQPDKPSVFDRLGPKPNNVFNQATQARTIFVQANQNVFGQTQPTPIIQSHKETPNIFQTPIHHSNVFQTPNQPNAKSLFAQATQSIFGQQPQSSNSSTLSSNTNSAIAFQASSRPTSNVFGTNVFEQNQAYVDDIYSKTEELSKSDIEAFESEDFKLGFIPELPPTQALCVM